jgi:hypothetical protein
MQTSTNINFPNTGSAGSIHTNGTSTSLLETWNYPERVEVNEVVESIEMIYKQTSMLTYTVYPSPPPEVKVFKIVYSCVDGKWNKSEPIYGRIIPAQNEYFEFDE